MRATFQFICTATIVCGLATQCLADEKRQELKIWPHGAPGKWAVDSQRAEKLNAANTLERIAFVEEPTITLYPAPQELANGCTVVVCPGGGYNILAWNKEGLEIAEWLNNLGVTAVVLKYRVPRRNPVEPHVAPLQDAQRTIRLVRSKASQWSIDPQRIGILGFSAGGHLTVMAGTHWDRPAYEAVDETDELSCRPDFLAPIYAAYLSEDRLPNQLSPKMRVNKDTPPVFMAVTLDDQRRGVDAALLLVELKKHGVPAELHVYTKGGHGYGLRPSENPVSSWPARCGEWLRAMGFLNSPASDAARAGGR